RIGAHRPPGRRRLSFRIGHATTGVLRSIPAPLRRSASRRRRHPQRGAYRAAAAGGAGGRRMGGRLPTAGAGQRDVTVAAHITGTLINQGCRKTANRPWATSPTTTVVMVALERPPVR